MKKLVLAVGFTVTAIAAAAENTSGNSLYSACTDSNLATQGFCIGYVVGIVEGIRYGLAVPMWAGSEMKADAINSMSDTILNYCPPLDALNGQYVDIVTNYLRDNPADRHMPARLLIHVALTNAFPCPAP